MRPDTRAQLKSRIRKYPRLSRAIQWVFDPAFTPEYLIRRWVSRCQGSVLNFGSGSRSLGPHVVNVDIEDSAHVHVVNRSQRIPFKEGSFDGVLLEYVLEHVECPEALLSEAIRVLVPGGSLLITVPFRQSYHGCPSDFWRFTHEGLEAFLRRSGLRNIRVEVYGGPTSAWIDATKEYGATLLSMGSPWAFGILSQALILPLIPLRYLDVFLRKSPVARYTAFSFQVVAQKTGVRLETNGHWPIRRRIEESLWIPEGCSAQRRGERWWIEEAQAPNR